jgi:choline dehydrogenase
VAVVESGPGPSDPQVFAQISDGLRLPIGEASSVVRRFETTLTDRPRRTMSIMRGAVVGGSGAVNGGYFCRGLPADFDSWNLAGWTWKDVLPHFRAIETDLDFDGPLHGSDGPMLIRRVTEFDQGAAAFVNAAEGMGYRRIADLNGAGATEQPVPAVAAVPLNIDDGTRVGPGGAFLAPAMGRPNLSVFEGVRAERVVVAGGRAVGVDCVGPDGRTRLSADRIVLCAGAIGSAHLLLLSGIGPSADLTRAGVSVVQDLPVGVRSADHPEWVLPVDWPAAPGRPPVEAVVMTDGGHEIRPYTTGFGAMTGGSVDDSTDRPHLGVTLLQPRSRGSITLVSSDATVPPVIDHRYDSEPADVAALEAGAAIARDLAGVGYEAREAHWSTSQHLCSTVPMGADEDASPLDEQCRVRGISGLWVVDGSIIPSITSRGPHATIVMIGHRAAEFIVR